MNKLSIYSLLLAAGCAFTACSSDDDDTNSAGTPGAINVSKTPGVLTTEDGSQVRITYTGNRSVSYDSQDRVKSVGSWDFSYSPFTISNGSYQWSDIKQNANGYITSMKFEKDDYYSSSDVSASCSMTYDGSGHLAKLTGSASLGSSTSDKASFNSVLTWSSGNLQQIVTTVKSQYDGESSTDTYTYVFGYRSSGNSNTVHQYNPFVAEALLGMLDDYVAPADLCLLGYLGVAGNNHPSSVECTRESSYRSYDGQSEYSFSYRFNNDGTLSSGSYDREYSSGSYSFYSPSSFSYSYKEYYGSTGKSFSKSQLVGTWKCDNDIYVLSANGTCESRAEDYNGNWVTVKGTWTLSDGNKLTLNVRLDGASFQITYYIKSLTNGKLVLVTTFSDDDMNYEETWYKQ